jgi:cysteinyl-tRNA synthetase
LLASVPYRNQLNFTFDGLKQAAVSVERLRNFHMRLTTAPFPAGATQGMAELARETTERMLAGMDDDLNTAQAQAAIFDMVRKANAAMDAGQFMKDDVAALLAALQRFDEVFAVLKDDDQSKMKAVLDWAYAEGRENEIAPELMEIAAPAQLTDEQVSQKLAEIETARKARDFKASDALRAELTNKGIMVESTKDGPRWSRKTYKTRISPLCPVAVKLNQWEVHAPDHDTWGIVSCDSCKDRFALGPNRIYGSQTSEKECVEQLEDILKIDHQHGRPHANSYELEG